MKARKSRPRKRNGIAAALRLFKPKIVKARKGKKAYRRKPRFPASGE
jgi:stalled ribosome alternative rescue factor ArfA